MIFKVLNVVVGISSERQFDAVGLLDAHEQLRVLDAERSRIEGCTWTRSAYSLPSLRAWRRRATDESLRWSSTDMVVADFHDGAAAASRASRL